MSFRLKTILGIALIEAVLLLTLLASGLGYLSRSNEEQLRQRAENTARLLARASSDAVLINDLATLDSLLQDLLYEPDVVYVRISNSDTVLAEIGDVTTISATSGTEQQSPDADDSVFHARALIRIGGVDYGTVQVGLSAHAIERVFAEAVRWTASIAAAEIILVALFSFVLGTYLTRQLWRLQEGAETVLSHGAGHQVPVIGNDELAAVTRSFNKMSAGLGETIQELRDTVSEHRTLAAQAVRSESMNKAVLAASLDAFITIDANGVVVEFNAVAETTFGWTREEMLGRTLAEMIIPADMREAHANGIRHYLATGEGPVLGRRIELEALHKDGHTFPIELAISSMRHDDAVMFTAFIRDVSERKHHENSLHLARFDAEQANETKTRFLATMSHEIRSPLNALVNMNALLLETKLDDEQREFARVASEGGQTLAVLINDVLDFSQIESGRMTLICAPFDLVQLLNGVLELLCVQAHGQQIDLVSVVSPEVPVLVHGDGLRVRQILVNLVGNAIKFTEQGGVLVRITAPSDGMIVIDVQDTGIGIARERHVDIFEEFVQADDSDSRRFGGSGLGLTIVQRLVRLMDGDLSVASEPGHGTQFCIRLSLPFEGEPICESLPVTSGVGVCLRVSNNVLARGMREQLRFFGVRVFNFDELGDRTLDMPGEMVMLVDADVDASRLQMHRSCAAKADAGLHWRFVTLVPMGQLHDGAHARACGYDGVLRTPVRLHTLLRCVAEGVDDLVENENDEAGIFCVPEQRPNALPDDYGPTVLLVEDSAANRAVALALLRRDGYQVSIAENGLQAVQLAAEKTFALVLMDLAMPEMDGLEATRRLRAEAGPNQHTPIVAMTANAFVADRERCLAAGMDDYVSKPIDIPAFREKVRGWVEDISKRSGAFTVVRPDDIDSALDERVLHKIAEEISWEVLPELIHIFLEETQARVPRLVAALAGADTAAVLDEAHALKSSAGSFGAVRLQALAREIEQAAHGGDPVAMNNAAVGLGMVAAQSIEALRHFLTADGHATTAD